MTREEARKKAMELVSQMTIEEKASQLRYDAPAISRLGIPAYNWWNEALHGVARAGQATVFPQAIGMAATFDEELIGRIADTIGTEGRAKYNAYSAKEDRNIYKGLTFWSPNINIFRDPRWGRGHETYGEDPYLTSQIGKAFVKGLQGDGEVMKAAACAKHYVAHSGPEGARHGFNSIVSLRDLEETYLPAFECLVKEAKVEAVMGAYNCINGEPSCGSKAFIQDKLRKEWGFEGHFVSDAGALSDFHNYHKITSTPSESSAMALNAGCDLNCGSTYLHILNAYEEGMVTEEAITDAAVRLFTTRYMLGLFDGSEYDNIPYEVVECKEHLKLSQKTAEESFVLLKNDGILPLNKQALKTVAVIGPNAFSTEVLIGNYYGMASEYVTILDGIREYLGEDVRTLYAKGSDLIKKKKVDSDIVQGMISEAKFVAESSDVVLLCVGLDGTLEGEGGDAYNTEDPGDKLNLSLPDPQLRLMEAMVETGKPVVLCLCSGSDIDLSYAEEHFRAIVQMWYPGAQAGRAAARLLFGETSAFGKLPITFYNTLEELPDFEDYTMKGRTYRYMKNKAQFPFGYGLNYGDVSITDAVVKQEENGVKVLVTLKNNGSMDTDEVVQIYVKHHDSSYATENPQLCAFKRVQIKAKGSCFTELELHNRVFTVVDDEGNRFVPGGRYHLYVGCGQPDVRTEELTGKKSLHVDYFM